MIMSEKDLLKRCFYGKFCMKELKRSIQTHNAFLLFLSCWFLYSSSVFLSISFRLIRLPVKFEMYWLVFDHAREILRKYYSLLVTITAIFHRVNDRNFRVLSSVFVEESTSDQSIDRIWISSSKWANQYWMFLDNFGSFLRKKYSSLLCFIRRLISLKIRRN